MSHLRYHSVLYWNAVAVNWLSVGTWVNTSSAPDARISVRGLVYPSLLKSQITCFDMPNYVARNKSRWTIVSKVMNYVAAMI